MFLLGYIAGAATVMTYKYWGPTVISKARIELKSMIREVINEEKENA